MVIQYQLPPVSKALHQIIRDPALLTIVRSGTKTGKTFGLSEWIVENALNYEKTKWWWTGPTYRQSKIAFNYMKHFIHPTHRDIKETTLEIKIINGSIIECKSGEKPDNLFGDNVNGIVIDEGPRVREESMNALKTTIAASGGQMKIIGNPKGKKNWFHDLCQKAIEYEKTYNPSLEKRKLYSYHHISTLDSPWVNLEEIEMIRKTMKNEVFAELFLGIPQDNYSKVFPNILQNADGKYTDVEYNKFYVMGYDIGGLKSQAEKPHTDFGCAVIMDRTGNICFKKKWKESLFDDQINEVLQIARKWNNARIIYDSTGIGAIVRNKFEQENIKSLPYLMTNSSKVELIYSLISSMEKNRIHYPNDIEIIDQLENFEHEYSVKGNEKFNASIGNNDDIVIAVALANYGIYNEFYKNEKVYYGIVKER